MTYRVKISPEAKEFIASVPYPNAIYNHIRMIKRHIASKADLDRHVHTMMEYDLDDIVPSGYFCNLINFKLADEGFPWRIRSAHLKANTLTGRTIMRRAGVHDLMAPTPTFTTYELEIDRVLSAYAKQFDEEIITRACCMFVFSLTGDRPGFYWLFMRYFDVWAYSDANPEKGWIHVVREKDGEPVAI